MPGLTLGLFALTCALLAAAPQHGDEGGAAAAATASPELQAYVTRVFDRIYDPREHGLTSLSFCLPIVNAKVGHTSTMRVSWQAGSEPVITFELAEFELPLLDELRKRHPERVRRETLREDEQAGRRFADKVLGLQYSQLQSAQMQPALRTEQGLVVVRLAPGDPEVPAKVWELHVDDDLVIQKMGFSAVHRDTIVHGENILQWELAPDGESLLLEGRKSVGHVMDRSLIIEHESYAYQQVQGVTLLIGQTKWSSLPGSFFHDQIWRVTDLVVNGTPVDVRPVDDDRDVLATAGEDDSGR